MPRRSAGRGGGQRRRDAARRFARSAARRVLERLRLRRDEADAVRRVRRAEPAVRVRPDEAARRGGGRRGRVDRAQLVAFRPDRQELRANDARARARARRSRPSSTTSAARRRTSAISRSQCASSIELPPGSGSRGGRRLHVGRVRRGDLRGGRGRLPRAARSRLRSSGGRRRGRPIPCCGASATVRRELPHWREGLRACLDRLALARRRRGEPRARRARPPVRGAMRRARAPRGSRRRSRLRRSPGRPSTARSRPPGS